MNNPQDDIDLPQVFLDLATQFLRQKAVDNEGEYIENRTLVRELAYELWSANDDDKKCAKADHARDVRKDEKYA